MVRSTSPVSYTHLTLRVQEAHPELKVDGELQFDAAVAPEVGKLKDNINKEKDK